MKWISAITIFTALATTPVWAEMSPEGGSLLGGTDNVAPKITERVGLEQKLGDRIPQDLVFTDDNGAPVKLGQYFGKIPVMIAPVYYECPSLCGMTMGGIFRGLKDIGLQIGKEYEVIFFSINPKEKTNLASAKKATYIKNYLSPEWAPHVHFLTADQETITKLTSVLGFKYDYDAKTKQYAHPSMAVIATPKGTISRYHFGVDFPAKDMRLSLVDASGNKIGSLVDHFLLFCYRYDPAAGKYGLVIMRVLRMLGGLTVLGLALLVVGLIRINKKRSTSIPFDRKGELL